MTMQAAQALSSVGFFQQLHAQYARALAHWAGRSTVLDAMLHIAWGSFDHNVEVQAAELPPVDCARGCATCCTLRVTATAPEVLMLARFIRAIDPGLKARGIDLPAQVAGADGLTQGLNEPQRVAARHRCPFIAQGVCVIYQVRPLACRGLASYDRKACAQAASGRAAAIPYSEPHMRVRSLVQNAMQSALRDVGLPWASYELNQALTLALSDATLEARWLRGEDVFASAQVRDVDAGDMAQAFDAIKALQEPA